MAMYNKMGRIARLKWVPYPRTEKESELINMLQAVLVQIQLEAEAEKRIADIIS